MAQADQLPRHPGDDAPIRVLIVEDQRVVAEGLSALINGESDMTVVGNVGSVAECTTAAAELSPDVVLLDFRLPDGSGPDAAAVIRGLRPAAKMIFLTRDDTDAARSLLAKRRAMEAQLERLTPREKEVLKLMAEGYSSRAIAEELHISYTTVRTHIRGLGGKLAVHSKLEAIVKARELGLIN